MKVVDFKSTHTAKGLRELETILMTFGEAGMALMHFGYPMKIRNIQRCRF